VSDSGRSDARNDIVEFAGPRQTLHLAPDSVGPRVYTEVNRRDACSAVEYVDPGHILHVALKRGVNNDNDVEQSDIVEFADPQTLQYTCDVTRDPSFYRQLYISVTTVMDVFLLHGAT